MEPINMGGCSSYFLDNHVVNIGGRYDVRLRGHIPWGKEIMPLIGFEQISSAYHTDSVESEIQIYEKCYQLYYLIQIFNEQAKTNFEPDIAFDEGG